MKEAVLDEKTIKTEVEALRADFRQVKDDIVTLTKTLSQYTSKQANESIVDLKQARDRIEAQVRQSAGDARETLEKRVHDQPLGTLAIAFGVGLLIGKLVGR
jgi:ElaB/YqjD/DUF883 family membrane-anchored ribosome-binding protein